ncbi:clusterin-like protein 1 [Notolabrus celidotus]|uniref:clusterin-like protein 1 n=1 Tax=Notolabrus celidotus TaxID=1203425 RepID=UPI0014905558|nr:clusterin-like protein 1 [Notolabrus celidotus]
MRRLLFHILCVSQVLLCTADSPQLSEDTLKELSAAGEHFVDEEIKRAVLGVKQVKELMEEKEEKHLHFMDALRQSSDKRKGAMQLALETEQRLEEAERQCQDITKSSFEECQPCLEDTCKDLYTSTCRRGFTSFSLKVEEFFKTLAAQLEDTDHFYFQTEENVGHTNLAENPQVTEDDADLQQVDASFGQLLSKTGLLFNQSLTLVKKMQQVFGQSFLLAFTADLQPSPLSAMHAGSSPGFFRTLGLGQIVDSVYDFGRNVMGEISSSVSDVLEDENSQQPNRDTGSLPAVGHLQSRNLCRRLRRQASECLQLRSWCKTCKEYLLKECPIVQQLHSDMEEMHLLLNASHEQYDDRLLLVRRHTTDTQRWLSSMEDKYRWISRLSNSTEEPHNTFSVITVHQQQQMKTIRPKADSSVVVTILGSGPMTVSVPAELEVDDPAFIQYAAQEALTLHKRQIKGME